MNYASSDVIFIFTFPGIEEGRLDAAVHQMSLYGQRSNSSASSSPPVSAAAAAAGGNNMLVVPQPINAAASNKMGGGAGQMGHANGGSNSAASNGASGGGGGGATGRKYNCKMCPSVCLYFKICAYVLVMRQTIIRESILRVLHS